MDETTKYEAIKLNLALFILAVILGVTFLVGSVFGAGAGIAAFFFLSAGYLMLNLVALSKKGKDEGDDK